MLYYCQFIVLPSIKKQNDSTTAAGLVSHMNELIIEALCWRAMRHVVREEVLKKVWLRGMDRQEVGLFRRVNLSCCNEYVPSVSAPLLKTPSEKSESHRIRTHSHTLPSPLIAAWAATFDILNQRTFTLTCACARAYVSAGNSRTHTLWPTQTYTRMHTWSEHFHITSTRFSVTHFNMQGCVNVHRKG